MDFNSIDRNWALKEYTLKEYISTATTTFDVDYCIICSGKHLKFSITCTQSKARNSVLG